MTIEYQYPSIMIISGFKVESVGEVEKHTLGVLHHILFPTFPLYVSVSSYSNIVLKLSKCYCWGYTVNLIMEILSFLSILRSFENSFGSEV
jgi:hypothetical protein